MDLVYLAPVIAACTANSLLFFVIGLAVGKKAKKSKKKYVCEGCDHSLSEHAGKNGSGKCNYRRYHEMKANFHCTCLRYVGDTPPPTLEELGVQ